MITNEGTAAVSIKNNASFHWGLKDPSQEEKDDEKKTKAETPPTKKKDLADLEKSAGKTGSAGKSKEL